MKLRNTSFMIPIGWYERLRKEAFEKRTTMGDLVRELLAPHFEEETTIVVNEE